MNAVGPATIDAPTAVPRSGLRTDRRPAVGRSSATGRERIPALDGLRALGLSLVVGFHFGVRGMGGGFFGVDLFYVLSGFLITGLLLGEWTGRGRIALGRFWARRARRLLPALVVMVAVVTLLVRFAEPPGAIPGFRMDALSALGYFSNWWQIHQAGNYFATTGPVSPLTHTWSLAVEEQFYLVWPLVVVGVLTVVPRRRTAVATLGVLAGTGAVASTVLMALRYGSGGDTTRLYFGTDTHAQSVLVGAALACVLTLVQARRGGTGMAPRTRSAGAGIALIVGGLTGLAVLLVAGTTLSGTSAVTYRGGFLVVALASAAVILAAVTVPLGPLARALSVRPVVWLGTISYGAYLWHFPVAVFLDGPRTGLTGFPLLTLRVAVTLAVSTASWVLIERPVLDRTFWHRTRALVPALGVLGLTCVVVLAATVVPHRTVPPVAAVRAGGPGLPADVRVSLAAAHAFHDHPVRFLLLGDSVAVTMGVGLGTGSVPAYGVDVINQGVIGCDLDTAPAFDGAMRIVPTSPCLHWRSRWASQVAAYHPAVVGLIVGFWSVCDHEVLGHIVHIGQPAWDAHLSDEYGEALHILGAHGAHVVLFTSPDFASPGAEPDGGPLPQNDPTRVDELNHLLRRVAAGHRDVTVVDLHRFLDPGDTFTPSLDGVTLRWSDGIHVTVPGGEWLQSRILPTVAALGEGLPAPGRSSGTASATRTAARHRSG